MSRAFFGLKKLDSYCAALCSGLLHPTDTSSVPSSLFFIRNQESIQNISVLAEQFPECHCEPLFNSEISWRTKYEHIGQCEGRAGGSPAQSLRCSTLSSKEYLMCPQQSKSRQAVNLIPNWLHHILVFEPPVIAPTAADPRLRTFDIGDVGHSNILAQESCVVTPYNTQPSTPAVTHHERRRRSLGPKKDS